MDRSNRWAPFVFAALAACTVEPRTVRVEPPPFDGGPPVDAGFRDAGASCLFGEVICGDGQYCRNDGLCAARPTRCAGSTDCVDGDVCVRPLVDTSTTTPGRCAAQPDACSSNQDCPNGVCLGAGVCGPTAERFDVVRSRPSIQLACSTSRDCGPRRVCRAGTCGACQESADCPRNLSCTQGVCVEAASCLREDNCYEGHTCDARAFCVRSVEGCTTDPSNDTAATPEAITDGYFEGLSICGNDTDWYELVIPSLSGAFVTIAAPGGYATLDVELELPFEVASVRRIDFPEVVAFSIPQVVLDTPDSSVRVLFSVSTLDRSTPYALHVQYDASGCADELDLYGDAENLLRAPPNQSFTLVGCPGDLDRVVVDGVAGDVVEAEATWAGPSMNVDLAVFDGATSVATATSPSTTQEQLSTPALTRDALLRVESTPLDAPFRGQDYSLTISRDLGSRQAACMSPAPIVLANNQATVSGDFTDGANLGRPRCEPDPYCTAEDCSLYAPFERRDRLFRLDPVMTPAVLIVTARPLTTAPVRMSVALLGDCTDDTSDVVCHSAAFPRQAATFERRVDTPDPVYLMVSSDGIAEDFAFELDVRLEPIVPPGNELCFDATDLSVSGTQTVSTYGAANDDQLLNDSAVCGARADGRGPDRFYRMTLAARERAAVEISGVLGGYAWAGTSCTLMTDTCTTAATISYADPVGRLTFEPGSDRTFYVAVDGLEAEDAGRFELRTIREPQLQCLNSADCVSPLRCDDYACRPVPTNDTCPGSSVTLDGNGFARIVGSTGAANDNHRGSCIGRPGSPDVVYALTLDPGYADVTFRVVDARFDPALIVRPNQCDASAVELCNDDVRFPDSLLPAVRIESPDAGLYYVVVDAYAGSGAFTLEIEATR